MQTPYLDEDDEYQRNDQYVGRMPSPPRISVPPLAMGQDSIIRLPQPSASNAQFIQYYDWSVFQTAPDLVDWRYENRRQAQQILPFLFLGPMTCGRDKSFLHRERITMVLAVRQLRETRTLEGVAMSGALRTTRELGLETEILDVVDNQSLIRAFPKAIWMIKQHLTKRSELAHSQQDTTLLGKVFVYCESGNERSAAVVAAFVMDVFGCGLVEAIQGVHQRRFCINVDDDMKVILSAYEDILQAQRDVANTHANTHAFTQASSAFAVSGTNAHATGPNSAHHNNYPAKRDLDLDDDDEGMNLDDVARFHNRVFVPFKDNDS